MLKKLPNTHFTHFEVTWAYMYFIKYIVIFVIHVVFFQNKKNSNAFYIMYI